MLRGWPPLLEAFHQKKHSFHLPGDDFSINWELSTQLKKGTFDGTSHKLFYMESLFLVALSPRLGCLNSLRTSSHFFFWEAELWRVLEVIFSFHLCHESKPGCWNETKTLWGRIFFKKSRCKALFFWWDLVMFAGLSLGWHHHSSFLSFLKFLGCLLFRTVTLS